MSESLLGFFFSSKGCINRKQWWLVQGLILLFCVIAFFVFVYIQLTEGENYSPSLSFIIFSISCVLVVIYVNIISSIKRFHDMGKSGLWYLITFVPFIGSFWLWVWLGFFPGTDYANPYNDDSGIRGKVEAHLRELMGEEAYLAMVGNNAQDKQLDTAPLPNAAWSSGQRNQPARPVQPAPQTVRPLHAGVRNQSAVFGKRS